MRHTYGSEKTGYDPAESRRSFRQRVRADRPNRLQEVMVSVVGIVWAVAIVMAAQLGLRSFGFGSDSVALRHLVAGTGCDAASEVGLAPAHRGDPGYWRRLDPANTGVSCRFAGLPARIIVPHA